MKHFLDKLYALERKSSGQTDIEDINIFNILFHGYEEVTLHSRFISYLLSLKEHDFLELFVKETLKLEKKDFDIVHCEVIPNEQDKKEYEEIDILIINERKKQAIIIENKIHAEPSIHLDEPVDSGYRGQLERYFNTITTGKYKNKRVCKYKCDADKTHVFYLTLYNPPTPETIGTLKKETFDPKKHTIDYYHIQKWLQLCIDNLRVRIGNEDKSFLKTIIQQYLNLIKKMTTDNEKALKLTNLIAENENYWQSAYNFNEHFNNVKWHTIHRFYTELAERFGTQIQNEEFIAEVAHKNKKKELKIKFEYEGTKLQIVNDDNGFTLGNLTTRTWGYFSEEIRKIKFCDFSNEATFHIINNEYRKEVIDNMVKEISEHHNDNYVNLKDIFR